MLALHLIPECYADTALVRSLFSAEYDTINHADGISRVAYILKKNENKENISIGFIDNDKKNVPTYFLDFEIKEELDNVIFKKHKSDNIYIFVFKKAIETFLLSELNSIDKKASDFGFDNEIKKFSKRLKKTNVDENEDFQGLISLLKSDQTAGCQFIRTHLAKIREMHP